jgi:hypothetical protein
MTMGRKLGLGTLLDTLYRYPTWSEALKRAAAQVPSRLTPFVKKLLNSGLPLMR